MHGKGLIAATLLLGIAIAFGVHTVRSNAAEARFLTASADGIPSDLILTRYALARGPAAYRENCATCHGDKMQGDRHRGIPNLVDEDWLYGAGRVSEIERIVLYGIRSGNSKGLDLASMPAFANRQPYRRYEIAPLLPREIDDITAYVLAFQHPVADAAVERGSTLFTSSERGGCWDCHGEDAKGDPAIGAPDLTDMHWLTGDGSRESIYDAVAYGLSGSCPAWITKLSPATVRSLAVYVATSRPESKPNQRPASQ